MHAFPEGGQRLFTRGLLTWRIFQGSICYQNQTLKITFEGDYKTLDSGGEVELEKVALFRHPHWQELLAIYANALAGENHPKLKPKTWKGWGSWDYYGDDFGERQVLQNLDQLKKQGLDCDLIQLDDGYCVHGGDWLDLKPKQFPNGMEFLTKAISSQGCTTGIWLAPFITHAQSRLAAERPEWLLQTGSGPLTMDPYPYYVLDYSIDEVCDWLRNTLLTMKHSWGIRYFKLDFLLMGVKPCASARNGMTPLERFHRCLGIVKETLSDDVYVLGCSAQFGPCIGYVHGMRAGPDIFPNFEAVKKSAVSNLSNYFLHEKVFNCDSDYLVLRSSENEDVERYASSSKAGSLTLNEARMWADFVSIVGNTVISSDKLAKLDKARIDILQRAFARDCSDECVPLDLWSGDANTIPGCILAKMGHQTSVALFNWNEEARLIRIAGFVEGECLISVDTGKEIRPESGVVSLHLTSRSSQIFTYSGKRSFEQLRCSLAPKIEAEQINFPSILGSNFTPGGQPFQIDLGEAAKLPLAVDRRTGHGMQNGRFAGVAEMDNLLGIPMKLGNPSKDRVIVLRSCDTPMETKIQVGRKVRSLYILHGCERPVKGKLNSYLMKFGTHIERLDLIVGIHIGNTHAHYIMPWTSEIARGGLA